MKGVFVLLMHLLARVAMLLGTRGTRAVYGEILIRQQSEGETSHGNDFAIANRQGWPAVVLSRRLSRPGCPATSSAGQTGHKQDDNFFQQQGAWVAADSEARAAAGTTQLLLIRHVQGGALQLGLYKRPKSQSGASLHVSGSQCISAGQRFARPRRQSFSVLESHQPKQRLLRTATPQDVSLRHSPFSNPVHRTGVSLLTTKILTLRPAVWISECARPRPTRS
jgi:hypothetical protein